MYLSGHPLDPWKEILKQRQEIQTLKVKSQSEKLKQSSIIIYSVAGILIIVLVMSFFIYKSYKQIQRTNSQAVQVHFFKKASFLYK